MTDNRTEQYKIGIIGDKESIMGFRAVGFAVYEAAEAGEAELILDRMAKENYVIIFITDNLAQKLETMLKKYGSKPTPAIIPLPGKKGSVGFGLAQIKKSVERAVGADILFK